MTQTKSAEGKQASLSLADAGPPERVASRLYALVAPYGSMSEADQWMPEGFEETDEAQPHQVPRLLSQQAGGTLGEWWLGEQGDNPRTPNWDIASTCTVDAVRGVIPVEANAHTKELKVEDQVKGSPRNHERVAGCIEEANVALAEQTGPCRIGIVIRWPTASTGHGS